MKLPFCLAAALSVTLIAFSQSIPPREPTAFTLAREGNKAVPALAKDKLTEIYSEKSEGTNAPAIWHIDYFDPTAAMKITEVTFVDGKLKEVTQPKRIFDVFTGSKQMSWKKLRVDSDRVLLVAQHVLVLRKVEMQGAQLWLDSTPAGPQWKIRLWASPPGHPDETTKIGELFVASRTGEIVKDDLHASK